MPGVVEELKSTTFPLSIYGYSFRLESSPPTQAAYITKCINLSEVLEYFTPLQKHTRSK